jgi:hypothetical protein
MNINVYWRNKQQTTQHSSYIINILLTNFMQINIRILYLSHIKYTVAAIQRQTKLNMFGKIIVCLLCG